MNTPIRLMIVANHPTVLEDMLTIFALADEIEVIGKAASLGEAVRLSQARRPDVALVDLEMNSPEGDGSSVIAQLKRLRLANAIVALTAHDYPAARENALRCGADGVMIKGTDFQTMTQDLLSAARSSAARR
jgi:DNA-binding NarL/FixJ family response regulator